MNRIIALPARGCRHYLRGRCQYEEHLNPGYHKSYRCTVLDRLQNLYDGFLAQADAFGLDETQACGIWEKRFGALCREDTGCQAYEPDDTKTFPGCLHCLGDVCELKLPGCGGRCENFTPKPRG